MAIISLPPIWNKYKDSPEGSTLLQLFKNVCDFDAQIELLNLSFDWSLSTRDFKDRQMPCVTEDNFLIWEKFQSAAINELIPEDPFDIEQCKIFVDKLIRILFYTEDNQGSIKAQSYREFASFIQNISLQLAAYNKVFFPILMPSRFDLLTNNFTQLGIELPSLPKTTDHKGCCLYYFQLNNLLHEFQTQNNLSFEETCLALYGFANDMQAKQEIAEMPKPTRVWFTGANKYDYKNLNSATNFSDLESIWACNESTHRGDIVIVYAKSPYSHIHSIWRAKTGAFFNPFDYYHNRTSVCEPVITPKVSIRDIKSDPVMAKAPIVRKNLQGLNGVELTAEQYDAILRLVINAGGDICNYPRPFHEKLNWNTDDIKVEKDVENIILIPLLKSLGYTEHDWKQQLKLAKGRGQFEIPDFAFFPYGEHLAENAPMIIEAKLEMKSLKERKDAFKQARSYAKTLNSKVMGITDCNRIIIYNRNNQNNFEFDKPVFDQAWSAIGTAERAQLMQLIGPSVIKQIIRE